MRPFQLGMMTKFIIQHLITVRRCTLSSDGSWLNVGFCHRRITILNSVVDPVGGNFIKGNLTSTSCSANVLFKSINGTMSNILHGVVKCRSNVAGEKPLNFNQMVNKNDILFVIHFYAACRMID